MPAALVDLGIMLFEMEQIESGEGPAQQLGGVKVSDILRAAGAVAELFRPVALKDQHPAGLQTVANAAEDGIAETCAGKLTENGGHQIETVAAPVPAREV